MTLLHLFTSPTRAAWGATEIPTALVPSPKSSPPSRPARATASAAPVGQPAPVPTPLAALPTSSPAAFVEAPIEADARPPQATFPVSEVSR